MKLVSFSPWQHTATSVPHSSNSGDVVHSVVGRPSTTMISSKRSRSSYHQDKNGKSITHEQPDLLLTTNHQISILGHNVSKKILKSTKESLKNESMRELPQWIYTSRPGEQSSFLPTKSDHAAMIGAVVDANSRSVFSLQKSNKVMKIWGLDNQITGPDEDEDNSMVTRIELPSPAVSMDSIPYRQQTRVKIKGPSSAKKCDEMSGGIAGIMENGQMFVVLISTSKKVRIGIYGKDNASSGRSSRRKSTSNTAKARMAESSLFSFVSYSTCGHTSFEAPGQKRKAEQMEDNVDSAGEITLTTLSQDSKQKSSIIFCKHTLALVSSNFNYDDKMSSVNSEDDYEPVNGKYSKETGQLNLPHEMYTTTGNGNGAKTTHRPVQITQLDPTHVGVVYQDASKSFFATILDIRYGERIVQPFPIPVKSPDISVVEIGGLSTSILAVLTSDDILSVYDIRRAIVLHEINVLESLELEDKDTTYQFGIATHWFSGTIGIIRKSILPEKDAEGNVQVSFAKIGVYDSAEQSQPNDMAAKPSLKGSYNLARAIASSMTTTSRKDRGQVSAEFAPIEENMMEWFPDLSTKEKSSELSSIASSKIMERLEKCRSKQGQHNGTRETLSKILSDATKTFKGIKMARKSPKWLSNTSSIPQRMIDMTIATAIELILVTESKSAQKADAIEVLMNCIKSGMFSGRNHFDKAFTNTSHTDVLRSLLFSIKKLYDSTDLSKKQIQISPLNLIYHLLHYCQDAIPEHMLVSIIHFVLCHISDEEFRKHWAAVSQSDEWYSDSRTKVLEKRLKGAKAKYETEKSDEHKEFIQSLENRLATSQKLFFIECAVTHSKCNTALLRAAIKEGLTQADKGEVKVLIQALSSLLKKAGKDKRAEQRGIATPNTSSCISQWLAALIDSNLSSLLKTSTSGEEVSPCVEAASKEVSAAVSQTQTLLGLKQLLDHVQSALERNADDDNRKAMDVAPLPLYGIESLIF